MESAVDISGGEFGEVKQMIDRIMILVEIRFCFSPLNLTRDLIFFRNSLRDRAGNLESQISQMKAELDSFISTSEKDLIASQGMFH